LTKIGKHVGICTVNKLAKFHGNILSLSENIAKKSLGGLLFMTLTVDTVPSIWIIFLSHSHWWSYLSKWWQVPL